MLFSLLSVLPTPSVLSRLAFPQRVDSIVLPSPRLGLLFRRLGGLSVLYRFSTRRLFTTPAIVIVAAGVHCCYMHPVTQAPSFARPRQEEARERRPVQSDTGRHYSEEPPALATNAITMRASNNCRLVLPLQHCGSIACVVALLYRR